MVGDRDSSTVSYESIVDDTNWENFEEFHVSIAESLEKDLKRADEVRRQYRDYLVRNDELRRNVSRLEQKQLEKAAEDLYSGSVAGLDGTLATFHLSTGTRCRIGVVGTSYRNNRVEKVIFLSERDWIEAATPEEHYENLGKEARMSSLLFRTIMFYKERDIALKRSEEWKLVHGPLIPSELIFEKGTLEGAFEKNLELAENLVRNKKVIAVVSSTSRIRFLQAGYILNPLEYLFADYKGAEIRSVAESGHLSRDHVDILRTFADEYASRIKVGVFKVGPKPYLFEAHEDYFDEAAAIIAQDSLMQRMRGFPLLLDYADSICKSLLSPADFVKTMEHKLMMIGGYEGFAFDIPERITRRR